MLKQHDKPPLLFPLASYTRTNVSPHNFTQFCVSTLLALTCYGERQFDSAALLADILAAAATVAGTAAWLFPRRRRHCAKNQTHSWQKRLNNELLQEYSTVKRVGLWCIQPLQLCMPL